MKLYSTHSFGFKILEMSCSLNFSYSLEIQSCKTDRWTPYYHITFNNNYIFIGLIFWTENGGTWLRMSSFWLGENRHTVKLHLCTTYVGPLYFMRCQETVCLHQAMIHQILNISIIVLLSVLLKPNKSY